MFPHRPLSQEAQRFVLLQTPTPTPEELYAHQAHQLVKFGLATEEEVEYAADFAPHGQPFLYVPEGRLELLSLLENIAVAYGTAAKMQCNLDALAEIKTDIRAPHRAYFAVDYDESAFAGKVSADDCARTYKEGGRLPLSATEIALRLLYFPRKLDKVQFAAASSYIQHGEVDSWHVPVFFVPAGTETITLDSFRRGHGSRCTRFPHCSARIPVRPMH